MLDSGPLRQRVTIQECHQVSDRYGQMRSNWVDAGTFWASVTFLAGRESVNAAQVTPDATHKIRMRYIGKILYTSRLVFNGRFLNIDSINNVNELKKEYVILCHENVKVAST